jgi:hypothetical protein
LYGFVSIDSSTGKISVDTSTLSYAGTYTFKIIGTVDEISDSFTWTLVLEAVAVTSIKPPAFKSSLSSQVVYPGVLTTYSLPGIDSFTGNAVKIKVTRGQATFVRFVTSSNSFQILPTAVNSGLTYYVAI